MSICDFQLLPLAGPDTASCGNGRGRAAEGVKPAAPAAGDPISRAAAKAAEIMRRHGDLAIRTTGAAR